MALRFSLALVASLMALPAMAANYSFPGSMPAGCSGSGGNYTCGSLTMNWNDTIAIGAPKPATITFNGNFSASNTKINEAGAASDLNIVVNGNFSLTNNNGVLKGSLTTTGSVLATGQLTGNVVAGTTLTTNSSTVITGNVSAGGAATLGFRTRITGTTNAASVSGDSSCEYGGSVTATSGAILLGSSSSVTGNVTANSSGGSVTLRSSTAVSGSVVSGGNLTTDSSVAVGGDASASGTITTGWRTTVNGALSAGGALSIGGANVIGGNVQAASVTDSSGNNTYRGYIQATGAISLSSSATVSGNVISSGGNVSLQSGDAVAGCLKTDGSKQITLGWHATVGGICCLNGTTCGTSCVSNGSGYAMPSTSLCGGLGSAATLIAEYRMEEVSWNGSAGELKDSAGYSGGPFNGQALGSPLSTPASAIPARSGSPGTCGYARLPGPANNGGAFTIPNLPVSTSAGAKTSVSFWMYWDGTNSVMPVGWHTHDLWLIGGDFGFNTGNSDVYGIASAGLANGWHHVAAVFTNGNVSANELYLDGVKQTLSQRRSSPNNNTAVVSSTLRVGGWQRDNGYRFSGRIDEVKVYNNALSQAQVTALYADTHTCGGNGMPLVGEWRMDEGPWKGAVLNTLKDSSGYGFSGRAYSNDIASTEGKICTASSFVGGSQSGFLVNDNPELDAQTVTMTAWVYPTAYGGWDSIVNKWAAYNMLMEANGKFRARMATGGDDTTPVWRDTDAVGLVILPLNQWSMVAATYDGRYTSTYVYDGAGALRGSKIHDFGTTLPVRNSIHSVRIGSWASSAPQEQFDGRIDEVKVFTRALSKAEIDVIASNESAGKNWDATVRTCPAAGATCSYPIHAGSSLSVGQESEINGHAITGTGNAIDPNTGARTTVTQSLGTLSPATFPSYSGGSNYSGVASGLVPGTTYNTVTLTGGTAPSGTYYINTLNVNGDVTFAGGTFYAKTMTVDEEQQLRFSVATQFRIGTSFSAGKSVEMLDSSGNHNPWAQFYLYDSADWTVGKEVRFDGIVVANGSGSNITADKELSMTGAFVTAGSVTLQKEADIRYTSAVQTALSSSGVCGGGTPTPTPPANFNCVEVGANASSGHLYTKLAGTQFSFDVVALKADGSVESDYAEQGNESATLVLVDGAGNTACASRAGLSPAVTQALTFTSADNGRKTVSLTVDKAYANLKCRVSDGEVTGCSSDNFAVRPRALTVSSTTANAHATGGSVSATPVIKAGADFSLTATGVAGYTGTPSLAPDISGKLQAHTGGVAAGSLSGTFGAANASDGVATGSGFKYGEVGYFRIAPAGVIDTRFTEVDGSSDCTDDFSNSLVGGKYGCKFGNTVDTNYFGRFIPDHFSITAGALTQGCNAGSFTYYGQPFSTAFTLTAQNAGSATTQNYKGGFARLALSWANLAFSAVDSAGASVPLQDGGVFTSVDWTDGVASMTGASHKVQRALSGKPTNPATITVKALPVDDDAVTLASATAVAVHSGIAPHRFGRLLLDNAVGSERLTLAVPARAQYWDSKGFITNAQDTCTNLTLPSLTAGTANTDNNLQAGDSTPSYAHAPLAAGDAGLSLSAPGPGKFGYLDLGINLADLTWLQYDWDGTDQLSDLNLFDDNPSARATFGKRGNAPGIIYRREVY